MFTVRRSGPDVDAFRATGGLPTIAGIACVNGATTVAVVPIAAPDAELVTWLFYPEGNDSPASLVVEVTSLRAAKGTITFHGRGGQVRGERSRDPARFIQLQPS